MMEKAWVHASKQLHKEQEATRIGWGTPIPNHLNHQNFENVLNLTVRTSILGSTYSS